MMHRPSFVLRFSNLNLNGPRQFVSLSRSSGIGIVACPGLSGSGGVQDLNDEFDNRSEEEIAASAILMVQGFVNRDDLASTEKMRMLFSFVHDWFLALYGWIVFGRWGWSGL
jgi:hypothetical protein